MYREKILSPTLVGRANESKFMQNNTFRLGDPRTETDRSRTRTEKNEKSRTRPGQDLKGLRNLGPTRTRTKYFSKISADIQKELSCLNSCFDLLMKFDFHFCPNPSGDRTLI